MEKFLSVLTLIGFVVLVFSAWSFHILRRHLKQFKNNYQHSSSLTDQKYLELKTRQEFIIASSTIIFALITFLGISSYDDMKSELDSQLKQQKDSIQVLSKRAMDDYLGLQEIGTTYKDSVYNTLKMVSVLNKKMKELSAKDVLNQNIFIIDPLRMGDFPEDKNDKWGEGFRVIKFSSLTTISGQKLPVFKIPPSVICFSSNLGGLSIKEITNDGFILQLHSFYPSSPTDQGENVKFAAWISQKPEGRSFNEDFSKEFR